MRRVSGSEPVSGLPETPAWVLSIVIGPVDE